jgi:hypothetical protein
MGKFAEAIDAFLSQYESQHLSGGLDDAVPVDTEDYDSELYRTMSDEELRYLGCQLRAAFTTVSRIDTDTFSDGTLQLFIRFIYGAAILLQEIQAEEKPLLDIVASFRWQIKIFDGHIYQQLNACGEIKGAITDPILDAISETYKIWVLALSR